MRGLQSEVEASRGEEGRELRLGLRGGIRRRIGIDAMANPKPVRRDFLSRGDWGVRALGVVVIAVPGKGVQGGIWCIVCPESTPP